jgi:hypothetical protein
MGLALHLESDYNGVSVGAEGLMLVVVSMLAVVLVVVLVVVIVVVC